MMSIRAVCLSALLITIPAVGQQASDFSPRAPLPKLAPQVKPSLATGRLIVKFKDQVQARVRGGKVKSVAGTKMDEVDRLTNEMGLTFTPLLAKSEAQMRLVEIRAAAYSGKAQPDLAGMMYVDGPQEELDELLLKLHAMNIVEFVEYDQDYVAGGPPPDPACGMAPANDCFDAEFNMGPFCGGPGDTACCTLVCGIRPFCCDEDFGQWDNFCADIANLFCPCDPPCHGATPDRCNAPLIGGGCFDPHPFGGCSDGTCCNLVCDMEPFCCVTEWDDMCANIASEICLIDDGGVTPDFTESNVDPAMRLQKYRTAGQSADYFARTGFSGDGMDIQGIWNIGEYLLSLGIGTENLSNGRTIRVGVVEHSANVPTSTATGHAQTTPGHEDLANFICEPGQTPFKINAGLISVNHGTACCGITVGEDNGFGVTGIARHAQGYFFPIVSQEAGGRTQAAMFSAIETFEAGDVLSFSIGPGGCGTLASGASTWTLMRLASDLGITCCIAAGNDCCNLDTAGQFGGQDCGAIIVGACWPGATSLNPGAPKFCRLGFSNHCQECDPNVGLVHCAAWGVTVTTTGYGDLFGPATNPDRHYTAGFNGTSAACPQIAGFAACIQGVAKMFHGIPLSPENLRTAISGNLLAQCSISNPNARPGSPQTPPCGGDFSFDDEPNLIGGLPDGVSAAVAVFAFNFYDAAPQVRDITLIEGKYIYGNVFSIKATDNNFYVIDSNRHLGGTGSSPSGQHLSYLGQGQITDVIVGAKVDQVNPAAGFNMAGSIAVADTTAPVIMFIEAFNWKRNRFDHVGFQILQDGVVTPYAGGVPGGRLASSYVNAETSRVEVRVWTLGLGQGKYRVFHDLINPIATGLPGPNPGATP